MPWINTEAVRAAADRLRGLTASAADDFTDPTYYPPRGADEETTAAYFLVMVAMDHRLSRPGKPYEAVIDGRLLHGADLLYYLGARRLREDPGFFTPERLASVTGRDILDWLCVANTCPPDPERRAALLRDLGVKLARLYDSNPLNPIRAADNTLNGTPEKPGLIQTLGVFQAYNDPVWKKIMLLAKFLERRRILRIRDAESKRVPVDNHVARIAYRIGIVDVEENLKPLLEWRRHATPQEDVLLRTTIREAWHLVAEEAGIDDYTLDDHLWSFGRRICKPEKPNCNKCHKHPLCRNNNCIFKDICRGRSIKEHLYIDTWWY